MLTHACDLRTEARKSLCVCHFQDKLLTIRERRQTKEWSAMSLQSRSWYRLSN